MTNYNIIIPQNRPVFTFSNKTQCDNFTFFKINGDDTLYFKQEMMLMDFRHSIKNFNVVSNDCLSWFSEENTW